MPKEFETFNEAFDFCREKNSPVMVKIKNETWKLYPSGKAEQKKNSPSTGKLGKTNKGDMLVDIANDIISNSTDPVKVIGDLIKYHKLSAQMYIENLRRQ